MNTPPSNLSQTITAMGRTNRERAARLGLSVRTVIKMRQGYLPEQLRPFTQNPELIDALKLDAAAAKDGQHDDAC
jgi:hypothetical protein